MLITFVDIAESNQLPQGSFSQFYGLAPTLSSTSGRPAQRAVHFTPISFFELNYHQESLQTISISILERQLHHDCSQVQLLFVPQYIISIRTGTLSEAVF